MPTANTPQKPRIKILRTEPHRLFPEYTDTIWVYDFGDPSNHRAVEAWCRQHPYVGTGMIDNRQMVTP